MSFYILDEFMYISELLREVWVWFVPFDIIMNAIVAKNVFGQEKFEQFKKQVPNPLEPRTVLLLKQQETGKLGNLQWTHFFPEKYH